MINHVLVLDLETTGLNPATDQPIELGVVVYSLAAGCVVEQYASLMYAAANAAEHVNAIPVEALRHAPHETVVWDRLSDLVDRYPDAVFMAHNAEFDHSFTRGDIAARLPWVCSKSDVEWPQSKMGASCVVMALAHGVPVVSAHRALTDCMLIAETMRRVPDMAERLEQALLPKSLFQALVTFDQRELAKEHGFAWNPSRRQWTRRMAVGDTSRLPFAVKEVGV